jgi:uncharacterized protein
MNQLTVAVLTGFLAGAMNAVAGGGSFVTVPALIAAAIPSVAANLSSTISLYPGSIASARVFRKNLRTVLEIPLWALFLTTLVGGFGGALLLTFPPTSLFDRMVPGGWWPVRPRSPLRSDRRACNAISGPMSCFCCWSN